MTAQKLSALVFLLLLAAFALISFLLPRKTFSETENRYLAKPPVLSVDNYLDASLMEDTEAYVSDHFMMRNTWITAKAWLELFSGKREINGVFVLKDRLIQKAEEPNPVLVDRSIEAINAFASRHPELPVYVMIAPTAQGIYTELLPKNAPYEDQKAFLDQCYAQLGENVTAIDAYSALYPMREEYIYYRNDHHWTTLGAYYAYVQAAKKIGLAPVSLNGYDIEHASGAFRGTLYSKTLYNKPEADTVDFYHPVGGEHAVTVEVNDGEKITEYDSMYFRAFLGRKDQYSSFLGQNQPLVTINTNVEGGKLLIVKDSYAHCLTPFFTAHYSRIDMVDLRYINIPLSELLDLGDYSQVLFVYNAINFAEDENIKKLDLEAQE